jgi:hypothetical protein
MGLGVRFRARVRPARKARRRIGRSQPSSLVRGYDGKSQGRDEEIVLDRDPARWCLWLGVGLYLGLPPSGSRPGAGGPPVPSKAPGQGPLSSTRLRILSACDPDRVRLEWRDEPGCARHYSVHALWMRDTDESLYREAQPGVHAEPACEPSARDPEQVSAADGLSLSDSRWNFAGAPHRAPPPHTPPRAVRARPAFAARQ